MAEEMMEKMTYDDDAQCSECGGFGVWKGPVGVYCANCGADLTPSEPSLSYYVALSVTAGAET